MIPAIIFLSRASATPSPRLAAADDKNIGIFGANTAQQCLQAHREEELVGKLNGRYTRVHLLSNMDASSPRTDVG